MICNGRNSASRSQHFVEQNHKHMEFSFILMTLIFLPNDRFDNPGTHRSLHSFLPVVDPPMFFFGLPPGFCSRQRFGNYGYARGACLQDEELVRVESFRRFQRCGVFIKQNRQTSGPSKKRPMGIRYSGFRWLRSLLIWRNLERTRLRYSLPETNSEFTPENGGTGIHDPASYWVFRPAYFSGANYVSFREGTVMIIMKLW